MIHSLFTITSLSDFIKEDMIKKNIWNHSCPVTLEDLCVLKVSFYDFNKTVHHDGEIMVHHAAAESVIKIFKSLFDASFPIEKIKLINYYDGDDEKSMADNNTSAFNFRRIMNTNECSIHSYGLAIDLNPKQNPYLITKYENKDTIPVFPKEGINYINRINIREGMVEEKYNKKQTVIELFKNNGFSVWGGSWNEPVDWHHFQVTRSQAEYISTLAQNEAKSFFNSLCS